MRMHRMVRLRMRSLFSRARVEQELHAELRDHLERQIQFHRASGLTAAEARNAALREFGNVPLIEEQCRDTRGVNWIEDLGRDLSYALRSMRRAPTLTAVAVCSLALGIGANIAIFGLVDAVVLRRLSVASPEQLVLLDGQYAGEPSLISYPMYRELAARQQVFSDVIACRDYYTAPLRVRIGNAPTSLAVRGGEVSGNYFSALGLVPARGRFFVPDEDQPGRPVAVAVVSHDFWQRELGGSSSVVGQTLTINEEPFTVIGVAPAGFSGVSLDGSIEIWVPLTHFHSDRELRNRYGTFFRLVARLKNGITVRQAQAAMTPLFQQLRAEELQTSDASADDTRTASHRIELRPADRGFEFFRGRTARTLAVLMAMAALLMTIVCLNLGTLLAARAAARQREMAVRQALGAGRLRLLCQLLTENILLATIGATLGLLFAIWAQRILLSFVSTEIALHSGFNRYVPDALRLHLDWRTVTAAVGIAIVAGVCLAIAPALLLNRADLLNHLKRKVGIGSSLALRGLRIPVRRILIAGQVALSVVLLTMAGLMLRTVVNLHGLDAGFDPTNVLVVDLDVTGTGRKDAQLLAFERTLEDRLSSLRGVRSASLSWISLFSDSDVGLGVIPEGHTPSATERPRARVDVVSPAYFETVGMTLTGGRPFTKYDNETSPPVAIVNEAFARRFFPNQNPIDKRFSVGRTPGALKEIVGLVRDAKYNDLRQSTTAMFYLPLLQTPTSPARSIQIRTTGSPQSLSRRVREVVSESHPNVVITESKTLRDQVDRTLMRERLLADLSGFFGAAALLLVCLGVYSVLAYLVVQRTSEIGVRIALGSSYGGIVWLVLRDALLLVGSGLLFGMVGALALSHLLSSLVFGVTPTDPTTIAAVAVTLLAVAGLSGYLPARRAARVDPAVALARE